MELRPFPWFPVEEEEFRQLEENELCEEELERRIQDRFNQVLSRSRNREIPPEQLYDIYVGMSESFKQNRPPVTLDGIWKILAGSTYLSSLGCSVRDEDRQVFEVNNIPGVIDGTLVTTSRETFEYGFREGGNDESLEFSTYGAPVFDRILKHIAGFELPACIKRIEIPGTETSGPIVGLSGCC